MPQVICRKAKRREERDRRKVAMHVVWACSVVYYHLTAVQVRFCIYDVYSHIIQETSKF
jgi:hypothetical protein